MDMRLLSIDPGDTTGYVIATVEGKDIDVEEFGEVLYPKDVRELLVRCFSERFDVVVVEDFIIRKPLIGDKVVANRIVGAFEVLIPEDRFVLQQPAEKQRVPDEVLETYDLHEFNSKHVTDAARHIVIWVQKNA